MEPLLSQSWKFCPFLKNTSPSALRALSTSTSTSINGVGGGGTMSNLQVMARRCPVMSKALAVQSVRNPVFSSTFGMRFSGLAHPGGLQQKRSYVVPTSPVNIQATPPDAADATSVESLHIRAGVFDTSKGMFLRNWECN